MVLFLSLIFSKQEEKLLFFGSISGCTCLILNINSTCAVIKIKYSLRTFFFYLCRLLTIDWFKSEIVTGQYNSRTGILNAIFPGGRGK